MAKVYAEHIDFAPSEQRAGLDCELILALWTGVQTHLFRTSRTMLIEEHDYACVGMGLYLGHYALAQLIGTTISVGLGAQVVAHVIAATKDYIEGVGKGTDVHILRDDGFHDGLLKPESKRVESQFEELFCGFRGIVSCAELWKNDEDLQVWFKRMTQVISDLRDSQRQHNERKAAQLERARISQATGTSL